MTENFSGKFNEKKILAMIFNHLKTIPLPKY